MVVMGDTIDVMDLPEYLRVAGHTDARPAHLAANEVIPPASSLEENERLLLVDALERAKGNQSEAARLLRIGRDALRYKMKKYDLS